MKSVRFKVRSTAVAAVFCAVVTGRARWLEDGVGAAWGATPAEATAAYVPWDDAERTRATVGTLALAATVADSNTVVVAGAGVEAANGTYALTYQDEYGASYARGDYELAVDGGSGGAVLRDTVDWVELYTCDGWPDGAWTTVEGVGTDPAPAVAYAAAGVTGEVAYARTLLWDLAHGWGNHAEAGYLAAEADPYAVRLDQSTPQGMDGFPLWKSTERVAGLSVYNGNGNNEISPAWIPQTLAEGTVSFWFKTTATVSGVYTKYVLQIRGESGTALLNFYQNSDQGMTAVAMSTGGSTSTLATPSAINDGQWRLFAATWKTNQIALLVDGAAVATATCGGTLGEGLIKWLRLGYYGGSSRCFLGNVDEVAAWTNALTNAEVADLFSYRIGVAEAGVFPSTGKSVTNNLQHLLRFEETAGIATVDWVTGLSYDWKYSVTPGSGGIAKSSVGTVYNEYLRVAADLERPTDVGRGVFQVGNAEATTRLLGALAVGALHAAPASATAAGLPGDVRIAADALYVCVATNSWVKAAMAAW